MYRDALADQLAHARMRSEETTTRGRRALEKEFGAQAREVLGSELERARELDFSTASLEAIAAIDASSAALEGAIARVEDESAKEATRAAAFAPVGAPSPEAVVYSPEFEGFTSSFKGLFGAVKAVEVCDALRAAALHWAAQASGVVLVEASPDAASLHFMHRELPFRLGLVAKYHTENASVSAVLTSQARPTTSWISIRAQHMGDDLASLFGAREFTFGDDEFDGLYFVSGDPAVLRAVLGVPARRSLVSFARRHVPTVRVGEGKASLLLPADVDLAGACELLASCFAGL